MAFTTVFVHFPGGAAPYEIARDARDPIEQTKEIEALADAYSARDRVVRVYHLDQYTKPWRQRKNYPIYESYAGKATEEFR